MGIFKAYDIRGVYGKELNEDLAYKIGQAAAKLFNSNKLVIIILIYYLSPLRVF